MLALGRKFSLLNNAQDSVFTQHKCKHKHILWIREQISLNDYKVLIS